MSYSGSLEKMQLTAYGKSDYTQELGQIEVPVNPEKYSHKYQIRYTNPQAPGSSGGSPDFNKVPSDKVKFELIFDGTGVIPTAIPGVVPFDGDGIAEQIATFKKLVFSYNGNIHSPNYLKLVWGTLLFKGRLRNLDITYTLFKPDGTPLRARANTTFIGYTDEDELARKANKTSPDLTHVLTVKAGDTLPLMCYGVYGLSALYPQVAEANDLTDFRQLTVGENLQFPPLSEAPP